MPHKLYESEFTFRPNTFPYNADVIAVWANIIGPLQISNRYYKLLFDFQGLKKNGNFFLLKQLFYLNLQLYISTFPHPTFP